MSSASTSSPVHRSTCTGRVAASLAARRLPGSIQPSPPSIALAAALFLRARLRVAGAAVAVVAALDARRVGRLGAAPAAALLAAVVLRVHRRPPDLCGAL